MRFYAMTDVFTGNNPAEPTSGFANTKKPISFSTRAARDEWLNETNLLTAKALTRDQAVALSRARGDRGMIQEHGEDSADFAWAVEENRRA